MDPQVDERLAQLLLRVPGEPFTASAAQRLGMTARDLALLMRTGLLLRPVRGVYVPSHLDDTLALRVAILRLIVPEDCVVTDRTAAWLWGAEMALPPGAQTAVPAISIFAPRNRRLRNNLVASGQRDLLDHDIAEIDGVLVTTQLRTACDAGRLLPRYQGIGVMDALARVAGLDATGISIEMRRFRGFRGVVQGRELAALVDRGAESPPESEVRLRWIDLGLPTPRTQVPVPSPHGGWFFVDVGLEDRRLGVEYFGEAFHGSQQAGADAARLAWLRKVEGWRIVVARRQNLYGRDQDFERLLSEANRQALVDEVARRSVAS